MAARKKTTPAPKPVPPTDEDGFLCLKGDRLWRWRAHDAELRAAIAEMDVVKVQVAAEIAKTPGLGALLGKQGELGAAISLAKSELMKVHAEIEEEFGVSLKECAFDDKTGRLYHLTESGERGAPLEQKKTKRRTR
jgi:hypothetical protein